MSATAEEYEDDYDDYYDDDEGVSGFVILIVGVVILAVFMAAIWFAYKRGVSDNPNADGNVPIIAAAPEPARTERDLPELATGNPEVFDTLEGNTPTEIIAETTGEDDPLAGFTETASAAPEVGETLAGNAEDAAARIAELAGGAAEDAGSAVDAALPATETPEPVTTTPEPQVTSPPVTQPAAVVSAASGTHVVQVGAFRSEGEATAFFDSLSGRFSTLLADKQPDIERADLGARGVFHRLRVGPFNSVEEARAYCTQLKNGGQDCLVKRL